MVMHFQIVVKFKTNLNFVPIQILFRNNTKEAYGIQYDRHGERRSAYARKEIILSAGAIQSPKILMLSGIGPKEHLAAKEVHYF